MKLKSHHIKNWVARHFEYKTRSSGSQLVICNPFDGDTKFRLWVSLQETENKHGKKNYWVHDFRPNHREADGSFINFVRKHKKTSYYEAVRDVLGGSRDDALAHLRSSRSQEIIEEEEDEDEISIPQGFKPISTEDESLAHRVATSYLIGRAVDARKAAENKLRYDYSSILFPYYEFGILVYWQKREIMNKVFEFPNESKTGLRKTDFLFGFDNVEPGEFVIVVESAFNTISLGDNVIASGGAEIAGKQIQKIKALNPKTIILAPDRDEAGLKSLKANYYKLKGIANMAYALTPNEDDWNRMDQEELGSARSYLERNTYKLTTATIVKIMNVI